MSETKPINFSLAVITYPVFDGLEQSKFSGREIAAIIGVSAPTLSKWRHGKARVPGDKLAFLTLLLANLVEELENLYGGWENATPDWHLQMRAHLEAVRESLLKQETLNSILSHEAIREGARLFRMWWNESRENRHMTPVISAHMTQRSSDESPVENTTTFRGLLN